MEADESNADVSFWRGCSMNEIYRNLSRWELQHVPVIQPSDTHAVLYHFPIRTTNEPPKPLRQHEKWDSSHVRLPCSSHSQYPVSKSDGSVSIESRWDLIQRAFEIPIKNSRELEAAVLSYNTKYSGMWKFRALHKLFEEVSTEEETEAFFGTLLPQIVSLALRLKELISAPIPLLKQGQNRSISMSQQQAACILANAFLCTFPRRNTRKRTSEYGSFPEVNFSRLFQSTEPQVIEKIKCLCHYFRRVCTTRPLGVLTFTRRSMAEKDLPKWDECSAPLGVTPLHVSSAGTIEDQGHGLLQVDFANRYLGGGVLGEGCVQEEIRFVICPELLVGKLFTEALKPYEALVMVGSEQFSTYSGYSTTFKWSGNFVDPTPMDDCRRRQCHIVAIDALRFVHSAHQYREELMLRELNKAYVGFYHPLDTPAPGVASGNWGCGAYRGEATLKALIQLMACTAAKRPLVYYTFGNTELRDAVHDIHTFFIENNITVKQLWTYLKEFRNHKLEPKDLYGFICQMHCDKQQDAKGKANSSWIQKVIASTKTLRLGKMEKETTSTSSGLATGQTTECTEIHVIEDESLLVISDCNDEKNEGTVKEIQGNTSVDLFASPSSPECKDEEEEDEEEKGQLVNDDKLLPVEPKAGGSDGQSGSKLRQKSLLEMLDCFYNKEKRSPAKRLRMSTENDITKG